MKMGNGWIFITVCVQMIILFMLYNIWRRAQIKSREGIEIPGKRLSYKEIPGQPKRYLLSVEYCIDGANKTKRILTPDKAARKFEKEEDIALIYVHTLDKVYWADEKKYANLPVVILLILCSLFTWGLMVMWILYRLGHG